MISREEIINLASLSKLYLDENELENSRQDMGSIIEFVNQINDLESPDASYSNINGISNAVREDEVTAPADRSLILQNAGGGKDGFFYIKKFM